MYSYRRRPYPARQAEIRARWSVGAVEGRWRRFAAFEGFNDRGEPIGDLKGRGLTGQIVIAQGAQDNGQVTEQLLWGGRLLALAVTADHLDQNIGGGAFRVEVIDGQAVGSGRGGHG